MHELIVNIHIHTIYSDGFGKHSEIAEIAANNGLDVIIFTDHNVLVQGLPGYYHDKDKRVLLLVGEEIHDQGRNPQKNHLLVIGVERELATFADEPQTLIDKVNKDGGLCFLAHPDDLAAPIFNETSISWVEWDLRGYTGIELWNQSSEFKGYIKSIFHALWLAYNPSRIAHCPPPETIRRWDALLNSGQRVVAIGGSDAHAASYYWGPLRRVIFPYEFHFKSINTHIFTPQPLSGDFDIDQAMVCEAIRHGHAFIGYDLPASTRGFRFSAQGKDGIAWMGDEIFVQDGVTFRIRLPQPLECHLLKNGQSIKVWNKRETCTFTTTEPGIYRVEVYINYERRRRGWIYSNPIYVR